MAIVSAAVFWDRFYREHDEYMKSPEGHIAAERRERDFDAYLHACGIRPREWARIFKTPAQMSRVAVERYRALKDLT